jgi:FXSXX-COOH protein
MGDEDLDIESNLIDLSGIDLALLTGPQDSALTLSLRRILRAAENPDEAIFGFQQSI